MSLDDTMKQQICFRVRCAKCGRLLPLFPSGFPKKPKEPAIFNWEPSVPDGQSTIAFEFGVAPCDHCDGIIRGLYARLKDALDSVDETDGTHETHGTDGTGGTGGTEGTGGEQ